MRVKKKKIRAVFHTRSGKDVAEGFYYELGDGEAVPSNPSALLHYNLKTFGFPVRTDYGIERLFPSDGDSFIRNLPQAFNGTYMWVALEEVDA